MAIDAIESKLRPPALPITPYPAKMITLADGELMVVREAKREEVGVLLGTVYPLIGVAADYYDIVATRMYEELLGWYRYRTANEFVLVGAIDGVIAGIVTSRSVSPKLGMSLHTLTIKRGLRIGAQLFAAKMEDHIEFQGADEVWIVAESPNGWRRWMIEYELEDRSSSVSRSSPRTRRRADVRSDPQAVGRGEVQQVHRRAPRSARSWRPPPN
jgi:hypothetical protein